MWGRYDVDLCNHFKTKKASRLLHTEVPCVIGHLICMWSWAMKMKVGADGDVSHIDRCDLAAEAQWKGDPDEFINALVDSGFLEADGDRLYIHDWAEYGGSVLSAQEKNKEKQARFRERQKQAKKEEREEATPPPAPFSDSGYEKPLRNGYDTVTLPLRNALDKIREDKNITMAASEKSESRVLEFRVPESPVDVSSPSQPPLMEVEAVAPQAKPEKISAAHKPAKPREPNPYWEALAEVFGYRPQGKTECDKWGTAISQIRDKSIDPPVSPEEMKELFAVYKRAHPTWEFTIFVLGGRIGDLRKLAKLSPEQQRPPNAAPARAVVAASYQYAPAVPAYKQPTKGAD